MIGIVQACSIAVISVIGVCARSVFVGCFFVVVACCCVGASSDFELVTDSVLIGIVQAYALAVVSFLCVVARVIVCVCVLVVVASRLIGTSIHGFDATSVIVLCLGVVVEGLLVCTSTCV